MKCFTTTILIFVLIWASDLCLSANTEFHLRQFTTLDGLSNNTVRHIMQDSEGKLWMCTSNGISLYDGIGFTNIHPSHDKRIPGLVDQRTQQACEKDGFVWIETRNGISCYDIGRERFVDAKDGSLIPPVFTDADSQELTDGKGRTWRVTANDGLYIVNNRTGETEHFTTSSTNCPLPTNALKCIFQDRDGMIWIGTDNLGVSRLKVMDNDGASYLFEGEFIRLLSRLSDGTIAVGNKNGDVRIYDATLTQEIRHIHHEYNSYCILRDHEGNLWEGTKGGGLLCNEEQVEDVNAKEVFSLMQDSKKRVWIGCFGEGLLYNGKAYLGADYGSRMVRKIIEDGMGNIWVATSNGVYIFRPSELIGKGKWRHHLNIDGNMLYSNEIRTLFRDSKGNIYIAENGEGFAVIDSRSAITPESIVHYTTSDSLVNNMVQSFVEDEDGFVWVATELGISRFSPSDRSFCNYFFSKNMLNNVCSENCGIRLDNGRLAFGTNNGLLIIDPSMYNRGKHQTGISADEVTVGGTEKAGIRYVMAKWWKSPWAWLILVVIVVSCCIVYRKVRKDNNRYHRTIKELWQRKEELISETNEVKERYSHEVRIRREEEKNASDQEFMRLLDEIASRELRNPDFSADDFSALMGMGRTAFFNKTKAVTGYSPKEYVTAKRIKRAAELVSTTTQTFSEIAFSVGIDDPLYFSRVFKRMYGMSPTEWRKRNSCTA